MVSERPSDSVSVVWSDLVLDIVSDLPSDSVSVVWSDLVLDIVSERPSDSVSVVWSDLVVAIVSDKPSDSERFFVYFDVVLKATAVPKPSIILLFDPTAVRPNVGLADR